MNEGMLLRKYDVPGPRYTSYPTVPYWESDSLSSDAWESSVLRAFDESNATEGISLYIHLPFCESLCTFCGCHKRITKNHDVEMPYVDAVLREWELYVQRFGQTPRIKELHLGGGTPTFFRVSQLQRLVEGIFSSASLAPGYECSFEAHPRSTSLEQLKALYHLGFRRCSFGIQDYDPIVQTAIHRHQSFAEVKQVHDWARTLGYTSISHDLVFGLPKQTLESVANTVRLTCELMPDRISFYSYAHVPWRKGVGQRGFDENDLPTSDEKRALYECGKRLFVEAGFAEIGMDHFAQPSDTLYQAMEKRSLHRNFMGYTAGKTRLLIGLGMSSISDSWYAFAQNEKSLDAYYEAIQREQLPLFRGHLLSSEDLVLRGHILALMCHFATSWGESCPPVLEEGLERLGEMIGDGLVEHHSDGIVCTPEGRAFVRNVCMCFDARMLRNQPDTPMFSQTV